MSLLKMPNKNPQNKIYRVQILCSFFFSPKKKSIEKGYFGLSKEDGYQSLIIKEWA